GAARERTAVDVAGGELGGQRLAVVDRRPADVAAVEGVLPGGARLRVRRARLDVDQAVAFGQGQPLVQVEVVAPEDVLVGGVAGAAAGEVADVSGEAESAVVDGVDRHVAARDVVAVVQAGAAAQDVREVAGQGGG